MGEKKTFNWRGWTTFVVTISFIVDTISGIILYIAPPGRIANWTNWTVWGLDKEEWVAIHTIFGYLLLIIIVLHLYYNWKIFINFLWDKIRKALNLRRELTAATMISVIVFFGSLWNLPPFGTIMDIGEAIKESWEESQVEVPIAHAELMRLEEFSALIRLPLEQTLSALTSKGFKVRSAQLTLGEIAKENNTSPDKLYQAIKSGGLKPTIPETVKGSGLGRKTLEMISSEKGISLEEAIKRLKQKGIDATPKDKLKEIASKHGKTPLEIFNIMKGDE
ncbi:MAG: DUF4405 domain-containing protein [Deltaproteobacteria bacterium]|nr:DUF4405 domain-containing protein [Deltaproteobacteria bacterium]